MSANYHLTYDSEKERWDIKKENGERPSDSFESHSKALKRARELTANADTTLILHDESGKIVGSESADDIQKGVFSKIGEAVTSVFKK